MQDKSENKYLRRNYVSFGLDSKEHEIPKWRISQRVWATDSSIEMTHIYAGGSHDTGATRSHVSILTNENSRLFHFISTLNSCGP